MANSDTGTNTSNTLGGKYQVFLSFRGSDTRHGFTDSLYHALVDVGIRVFIDDEELSPGERISDNLLQAIDDSKLYIPIFSKNYASSHWCLRELAKMVENTFKSEEGGNKKAILPIFYDVKPDDVKLKTPLYSQAILNLEEKMEDKKKKFSSDEVETWREALKKVDGVKGWELEKHKGDGKLTKLVVHEVLVKLETRQRPVTKVLVGMEDHIAAIENLLDIDSGGGVRLIGIYGMGGIGKTTLAKIIFNQLCPRFGKYCSFLDDVRETAKTKGLIELQRKLLSDIAPSRVAQNIGSNTIGETICNKEVLIVLDDVNDGNQIQDLIGGNSLYPGTIILVTTRDKSIQKISGLKYKILPYEMDKLNEKDALRLFSRHAFNDDSPPATYYTLSKSIVSTTDGLPLALEVIGASFNGEEDKEIWEERLKKLKETPDDKVLEKLSISYDALQSDQQRQIFLDIACFFVGKKKTNPMYVWEVCKFCPKHVINVLIKRSMIKDLEDDRFRMHDQLRDLGRAIAKDTRLWDQDDIICKLRSIEIKERVLALRLPSGYKFEPPLTVTSGQIQRFPHMRFLWSNAVTYQGDFTDCLSELKWINLHYPYSVPPGFITRRQWFEPTNSLQLETVAVVKLSGLDITEDVFERLIKGARSLKVLTLCYNESIHGTLTFPTYSVLEKLAISKFFFVMEIHRSIGELTWLTDLSFESCWDLRKLPDQIGQLQNLQHLSLRDCHSLSELPNSVSKLKSLTKLDVSRTAITRLPDKIGRLPRLSSADVSFTPIAEMPSTMRKFRQLKTLDLDCCHGIQKLPELPKSLTTLRLRSISLLAIPNLSYLTDLVELVLSDGSDLKARSNIIQTCDLWWIGRLSKLSKLRFCFSNVCAPTTELGSLSLLRELTLYGLDLPTFEQLPSNLILLELYDTQGKQVHLEGLPPLEKETDTRGKQVHLEGLPQLEKEKETDTRGKQVHLDGLPQLEKEKETDTRGKQVHLGGLPRLEKETAFDSTSSRGNENTYRMHVERQLFYEIESLETSRILDSKSRKKLVSLPEEPVCNELQAPKLIDHGRGAYIRGKEVNLDELPRLVKIAFDSISSRENEFTHRMHVTRQFSSEIESLQKSRILDSKSRKRLVSPPEEPVCNELQAPKLIDHGRGAFIFPSSQKMLQKLILSGFSEVQDIQFVSVFISLEVFSIEECSSLKSLGGLSNLKNLKNLSIIGCTSLQVVEGIDKLEYLYGLEISGCRSMERIFDASSSKIPNMCSIFITCSGELPDCGETYHTWDSYRKKILNGTKEASDSEIEATDSEIEATDSETETGDPLQETENEEKNRESKTESVSDHESSWD